MGTTQSAPVGNVRCYVASPLGFTEGGRHYYTTKLIPALAKVVEPVDPWSLGSLGEAETARTAQDRRKLAGIVGRRNIDALRSCGLLVAYLEGQELDSGTASEIGYASALGLQCFGLRSDLRAAGELECSVNLQVQAFIHASGGEIVANLDELCRKLERSQMS